MSRSRTVLVIVSFIYCCVVVSMSIFSDVYFLNEETNLVEKTSSLKSSGSDDSDVFFGGNLILSLFFVFYELFLLRKQKVSFRDVKFSVLFVLVSLGLLPSLEVGSLFVSIFQPNGWLLITWIVFVSVLIPISFVVREQK